MRTIETAFTALGTINHICIPSDELSPESIKSAITEIKEYMWDMDDRLSVFKPDSLISQINRREKNIVIDDDTRFLLALSDRYKTMTDGCFNICPVKENGHPLLDLGGIAKGYAMDKARSILRKNAIQKAMLNFGGTVAVFGAGERYRTSFGRLRPPYPTGLSQIKTSVYGGERARIGIRNPFLPVSTLGRSEYVCELDCRDEIVVTSGIYENGSHILDPSTGKPAETELVSVTLIGNNGAMLDAFATACMVKGLRGSIALCERFSIEAIFILKDGNIIATRKLQSRLHIRKEVSL